MKLKPINEEHGGGEPYTRILIFKGGGYDGCFWEWNAIFIDSSAKQCDLQVSGRAGKRVGEWFEKAAQHPDSWRYLIGKGLQAAKDEGEIYDIKSRKDWEYFCREWNAGFVR